MPNNDHARILTDARKLIEDPEDWTPNVDPPKSCLVIAVVKAGGNLHPDKESGRHTFYLDKAAMALGYGGAIQANWMGHAVAMQVMDLAIQYAMEEQNG